MSSTNYINFSGSQRLTEAEYEALDIALGNTIGHWDAVESLFGDDPKTLKALQSGAKKWQEAGVRASHAKHNRAAKAKAKQAYQAWLVVSCRSEVVAPEVMARKQRELGLTANEARQAESTLKRAIAERQKGGAA